MQCRPNCCCPKCDSEMAWVAEQASTNPKVYGAWLSLTQQRIAAAIEPKLCSARATKLAAKAPAPSADDLETCLPPDAWKMPAGWDRPAPRPAHLAEHDAPDSWGVGPALDVQAAADAVVSAGYAAALVPEELAAEEIADHMPPDPWNMPAGWAGRAS